jgi:hypothetical protein
MRLQAVRRPDPLHRAQADSRGLGHRAAGPVGRLARRLGAGQRDHLLGRGGVEWRLAGLAAGVAQQAVDAGFGVASLPAPDCRPADVGPPRDLGDRQARGRRQNDPSPRHVFLGAVAIGDSPRDEHDPPPRPKGRRAEPWAQHRTFAALVNPLNASVHQHSRHHGPSPTDDRSAGDRGSVRSHRRARRGRAWITLSSNRTTPLSAGGDSQRRPV